MGIKEGAEFTFNCYKITEVTDLLKSLDKFITKHGNGTAAHCRDLTRELNSLHSSLGKK